MLKGLLWALPISMLMWAGIASGVVTLRDMIGDDRYWPQECVENVCVLTGLGGIVGVWEKYIDDNTGAIFIVNDICASACEIAYQRALLNNEVVILGPVAKLIPHNTSLIIFDK